MYIRLQSVKFYTFDRHFSTHILYKKEIDIAELLLKTVLDRDKKRTSNRDVLLIIKLQAQNWNHLSYNHFPKCIDPTPLKAYKVCTQHKKCSDRNSKKCKVALHIPDYFEKHQIMDNY